MSQNLYAQAVHVFLQDKFDAESKTSTPVKG